MFCSNWREREFLYAYQHFLSPPLSTLSLIQPSYETESLLLREQNEEMFGKQRVIDTLTSVDKRNISGVLSSHALQS